MQANRPEARNRHREDAKTLGNTMIWPPVGLGGGTTKGQGCRHFLWLSVRLAPEST
jgi:hypothetical protein